MTEIIKYIIQFLTGGNAEVNSCIGYTADEKEFADFKIVIKASGFFNDDMYGKEVSLPTLPLEQWEEIPILFGDNHTEIIGNTLVIHADIIAGTYFLISRYEEMVRESVRDNHNRFPGKESLPYRAGFIDRPIIEEWGVQLRIKMRETGLDIEEPPQKIKKVFLTHDVDQLAHFRNIRGMMGGVLRGLRRPRERVMALKSFFGGLIFDPWYTFPYIYKLDDELRQFLGNERCEVITFLRSGGGRRKEDKPVSNLLHPDYQKLITYTKRKKITIGLHSSYEAGCNPLLIADEKIKLDKYTHTSAKYNRNHYLNNRNPEDFEHLIANGITDDFSMGYADMAGFRLGTCRAVRWINPVNKTITNLTLHNLTIMDVTLSEKKYMFMNAHDALLYCESLISTAAKFNGEISLLWHNNSLEKNTLSYHRILYRDILKSLHKSI